jgi:hypothetical protein
MIKMNDLEAKLGEVESLFDSLIEKSEETIFAKRKITNKKTWRRATIAAGSEFTNKINSLLDKLSELYTEIAQWPEETEDE